MTRGDVPLGATVDLTFTTRQFSTGTPFSLSGSPAVAAYANNSTTPITSGITLTTDFAGVTGLNHVRVAATTGNGFASGSQYSLVLSAGTVDGVSVAGETIGGFSIEASAAGALGPQAKTDVRTETSSALAAYGTPTSAELLNLVRLMVRKDAALASDLAALVTAINADLGSGAGTYANTTDAQEALRDRGDAAWTTASGFATPADVTTAVSAVLTAPVADSIPAMGNRPSIAQAAYLIVQFLLERAVSGTTMTVRKPDGSTTLLTMTLDNAMSPSSVTRAT